jgi:nicotinamide riboside kinase
VEQLPQKYTYKDVEAIARMQIQQEKIYQEKVSQFLIFDTWLIVTKVWFDLVFGKCPDWVISHIESSHIDLFLICGTDIPWISDPVRENGGEKRERLLDLYCQEIRSFGFEYSIVNGIGEARLESALIALKHHQLID